ncbi:unnamed protein product [Psylliodes chrysocephalus]|uniref:Uncharacterized protein n=1 Tax=Psylliodes chrysocephalus TaxID=3402493 RepID=A0A9P0CY85_9CUCU|nr:unnamed protein product [Psylliodes chrysocephala]
MQRKHPTVKLNNSESVVTFIRPEPASNATSASSTSTIGVEIENLTQSAVTAKDTAGPSGVNRSETNIKQHIVSNSNLFQVRGFSFATLISCYTITKDLVPILPSEKLEDDVLVRKLPNGSTVNIICTDDTVLNKKTLTCDFKVGLKKHKLFYVKPVGDDCSTHKTNSFKHTIFNKFNV